MRRYNRWFTAVTAVLFSLHCSTETPKVAQTQSFTLKPESQLRLFESDTAYIGRPIGIAVSHRGDLFITDGFSRRVLRFNRAGKFQEAIGRMGNGPNEFMQPALLVILDDSTLLVDDEMRRDGVLWNLNRNQVALRLRYSGMPGIFSSDGEEIFASSVDYGRGTMALKWKLPSAAATTLGTIPTALSQPAFGVIWGRIPLEVLGDSIIYVSGDRNMVWIADKNFGTLDSIDIPVRHRRGIPANLDTSMSGGRNIYDVMKQVSNPYAVHRLSDGRIAVVFYDAVIERNVVSGRAFVTIVAKGRATECVDMQVPSRESAIPRLTFLEDTLFVLDHFSTDSSAVTELLKFNLASSSCWGS